MFNTFDGLSGMTNTDVLKTNTEYTITFNSGAWIQPFESTIANGLRERMLEGSILNVSRSFASGRYAITFQPLVEHNLQYWIDSFTAMFYDMGYKSATYQTIDVGKTSSQTGGVKQVAKDTVEATTEIAGSAVNSVLKNLWIPIAIVGAIYLGGQYLKGAGGAVYKSNPKKKRRKR